MEEELSRSITQALKDASDESMQQSVLSNRILGDLSYLSASLQDAQQSSDENAGLTPAQM